jgi:hypothetical protein
MVIRMGILYPRGHPRQHGILSKLAREGGDTITPIITELERTKQTEPIFIIPSGVVVNGHRRLAAMRDLYTERAGPNSRMVALTSSRHLLLNF